MKDFMKDVVCWGLFIFIGMALGQILERHHPFGHKTVQEEDYSSLCRRCPGTPNGEFAVYEYTYATGTQSVFQMPRRRYLVFVAKTGVQVLDVSEHATERN